MAIFTISEDFLSNTHEDLSYLSDILFVFSNKKNSFKVSKDINGEILQIYKSIPKNGEIIKTWLDLMSYTPSSFEKVDIDLSSINCLETKFIKLCKETKGFNNLIVYSVQNIKKHQLTGKAIVFEEVDINVFDRDEASIQLNIKCDNILNIVKSQVAMGNSNITDSQNSK
ncbi:hypothetical protein [Flavobacterium nitrogenifigens]|uniref:Uncharacterized protein n=1 Tax=Flavobacterium nitrogenifigens TaxID=1617283 RepID=A0A521DQJ3_9FLAO|nr:hypothetical protein [Flavobacterium nitrogenifigens]KAF2327433.1 hypothetical protein DM397_18575 [Flavobacterium nitrogenifigens]SMO73862.1 hypothetical protein SAMN06265220_103322 [Flavobacterium nitrogenifigens]